MVNQLNQGKKDYASACNLLNVRIIELQNFDVKSLIGRTDPKISVLEMKIRRSIDRIGSDFNIGVPFDIINASSLVFVPGPFTAEFPPLSELSSRISKLLEMLNGFHSMLLEEIPSAPVSELPDSKSEFLSPSRRAFIVHGRDDAARQRLARFLEKIEIEAIILDEQVNAGRTIIEKIECYSDVGFAFVLLTPDDTGGLSGSIQYPRARQNVILELGYFIGRLGRGKVCVFKKGADLEMPSDMLGVGWNVFDEADGWKLIAVRELRSAGIEVDSGKAI